MSLRICWPVISMTSKPQFGGERVKVSDVFDLQMGKTPSRKNLDLLDAGRQGNQQGWNRIFAF